MYYSLINSMSKGGVAFDSDAQAFITAASITDTTQKSAINTLVLDLKSASIWTKMKALYPFVGGTASQHKFNLKDPRDLDAAYRLVFNGGWVHSSTGALPNGTTGYADTYLIPSNVTGVGINYIHYSFYSKTNKGSTGVEFGAKGLLNTNILYLWSRYINNLAYFRVNRNTGTNDSSFYNTNSLGLFMVNRYTNNVEDIFINNTKQSFNQIPTGLTPVKIFLSAINNNGIADTYGDKECAFFTVGDGLTDTEAANFYTAVQTYQTTLGRQI